MDEHQPILDFFGLKEEPFAATADPAYFYATRGHKECLYRLWHSVDQRHGIAVVLGNYGSGKTTMLRKLLTGMKADPNKYNTAIIGSPIPSWTSFALLEAIILQFGLHPKRRSFMAYMEALNQYLLANRNRITTLIIDDAQNLNKRGQLELLRLAQNLETPQHKLLNLVFLAQLEWTQILLAAPNFEQRINMTYTLDALNLEETTHLVSFRLKQAGATRPIFTDGALKCVHAYSEGNPRLIATLCRNTLVAAARTGVSPVSQDLVIHTIEKTTLPDRDKRARVAQILAGAPAPAPTAIAKSPAPSANVPPSGVGMSRDDRARKMLLRTAQQKT
jgi:general secretion pathway protein A